MLRLRTSLSQLVRTATSLEKSISKSFLPSSSSSATYSSVEVDRLPNEATPWLMLKPEIDEATGDKVERFYSPGENKLVKMNRSKCLKASNSAKCVGSTLGGWLGYVDPNDCSVMLSNPYLNKVIQLPSVTTLPSVLDFRRDSKTGAVVGIKMPLCDCHHTEKSFWTEDKEHTEEIVAHMFSNMAISGSGSVVLANQGRTIDRLVYLPIIKNQSGDCDGYGVGGGEWVGLQEDYDPRRNFHQGVYSSKTNMFYTMSLNPGIQAYDLENDRKNRSKKVLQLSMNAIFHNLKEEAAKEDRPRNEKLEALDESCTVIHYYLVPLATGDVLLLKRHYQNNQSDSDEDGDSCDEDEDNCDEDGDSCDEDGDNCDEDGDSCDEDGDSSDEDGDCCETLHFDLYKVNFEEQKLERMTNLGNMALFVGRNQSFSISVDDVPGIRANSIYFTDDRGYDSGIFNLSDYSVVPLGCDEPEKVPFLQDYSPFWVAPRLLIN